MEETQENIGRFTSLNVCSSSPSFFSHHPVTVNVHYIASTPILCPQRHMRSSLRSLQEQLETINGIRQTWEDTAAHITVGIQESHCCHQPAAVLCGSDIQNSDWHPQYLYHPSELWKGKTNNIKTLDWFKHSTAANIDKIL